MKRENKRIKRTTGYSHVRSSSVNTASPHSLPAIPRQRVQHKTPCSSAESLSEKPEIVGLSLFYGSSVADFPHSSSSTMSGSSNSNASHSGSEPDLSGIGSCANVDLSIPDLPESEGHEGHRSAMQKLFDSTNFHLGPRNGQGNSSVASVDGDEDDLLDEISRIDKKDIWIVQNSEEPKACFVVDSLLEYLDEYVDEYDIFKLTNLKSTILKKYSKVCDDYDRARKEAMQKLMDSKDMGPASTKTSF